eukprot:GHVU01209797.1.p2 GENE.GHVU01209797.1~~GHVU01209797.1.p2  ORF type:complete len:102 (+),score=2.81 GHVU01209797.1:385-690(+)
MKEFKEGLPRLHWPVHEWKVFLTTELRYRESRLMNPNPSMHVFKEIPTDLIKEFTKLEDNTYHLLLLKGSVSRSWKPEARAGRSRTGTCLCPNLPWPRRWY